MESPTLSENYWRLHRNSLAASSLLFLASNNLIKFKGWENLEINISPSLIQVFSLFLATYAIFILYFEGSREENINSVEFLESIRNRNKILIDISNKISTNLSILLPRINTNLSTIEQRFNHANSNVSENELEGAVQELAGSLSGLEKEISKIADLSKIVKNNVRLRLFSDKFRIFLSGFQFPATIYATSLLHFIGLYFPIFKPFLEYLKFLA